MKRRKPSAQRRELVEAEHRLEADHDETAFEKRLRKIAKEKPKAGRKRKK